MAVQRADGNKTRPLDALGINEAEERVYRYLLDQPGTSASEVSKALSLPKKQVQRELDTIRHKGLVTQAGQQPRRYTPVSPDIALNVLVLRRQEELQRAEGEILELQNRVFRRRKTEREPMVELIVGREALSQVYVQMDRLARDEVLSLVRSPILVSRLDIPIEQDRYEQIKAQARGVNYRSVIDKAFLTLPFAVDGVRWDIQSGEDIRIVPHLPFKMVLSDHRLGIIPLDLRHAEGPVLLVRPGVLLDALYALFEFYWERAAPVSFSEPQDANIRFKQNQISDEIKKLLSMLATGMNDKRIAHELKMSRSTYSRRIAEAMNILNAGSRFQLGWRAMESMSKRDAGR